ncbi:MAG: SpoIIE family protein phosphatase [Solirubrobacterales bacterium]|nr:SpoIIE family protein phosphatase [Solirubrobacterales bacterium]
MLAASSQATPVGDMADWASPGHVPPAGPVPLPRRSDALANVARIVQSAAELLAHDPDVSIGEIAHHAGVGRSTLYRHFETRESLVEAVRRRSRDIAETDQPQHLRPAGDLANRAGTPLSVADVLNKVPPYQLGDQIVAEAQRLTGVESAALYLADLQGRLLRRLAGTPTFPEQLEVRAGVGTEIPREAFDEVRDRVREDLPGAMVVPLILRGRATGVLVIVGERDDAVRDLAREAAAALALADGYTDALQCVRRERETSPAAELQQQLLPPRIVRLGGATLAGNVLPGYDVGGDWFDFADNADCVWIGTADVDGNGPRAAGLAAILLGAFRSGRLAGEDPAGAMALMHDVLAGLADPPVTGDATLGTWNSATSVFRWVSCGSRPPLLVHADGELEELPSVATALGSTELQPPFSVHHRRLERGQRILLASDGILESAGADGALLGLDGIREATRRTVGASAAATVHAIESVLVDHLVDDLQDDATVAVLAPEPSFSV